MSQRTRLGESGQKERQCRVCGEWKPLDRQHFHRGKDASEGYQYACVICNKAASQKNYAELRRLASLARSAGLGRANDAA